MISTAAPIHSCHCACAKSLSDSGRTSFSARLASTQILDSTVVLFAKFVQTIGGIGQYLFSAPPHLRTQRLRLNQNFQPVPGCEITLLKMHESLQILGADQRRFRFASRLQHHPGLAIGDLVDETGKRVFRMSDTGLFYSHIFHHSHYSHVVKHILGLGQTRARGAQTVKEAWRYRSYSPPDVACECRT